MSFIRPHIALPSLSDLSNKNAQFSVDGTLLTDILESHRTPLYVTSLSAVKDRINTYQSNLKKHFVNSEIFYAMKANFSQPILSTAQQCQSGVDIVSIGEWRAARQANFDPSKICFAGVGKKQEEWSEAISQGIGFLNVEHLDELEDILNYIQDKTSFLTSIPCVSLRLNPCVDLDTHPHLITGAINSKFGVLFDHFKIWLKEKKSSFNSSDSFKNWIAPLRGIHVHLGSQLLSKDIFALTIKKVLDCAQYMSGFNVHVNHLDLGGGLGVGINGVPLDNHDISQHVDFLCTTLKNETKNYPDLFKLWGYNFHNLHVSLEPGRSIVASSTVFLTTVLYTKINSSDIRFCYVDGGMNDFPRPSIYDAVHHVELVFVPKALTSQEKTFWQVVGPVCESGDFLSKKALLPSHVDKGSVLAFFEAGAYCRSMASQYNLRPLPDEMFI